MSVKGNEMSVSTVSSVNMGNSGRFAEFNTTADMVRYEHYVRLPHHEKQCNKTGVFLTTLAGVGSALALISKKQGFSLNPKNIMKTPLKDWAIFGVYHKNRPSAKVLDIEEPEILALAAGSVAGGLAGGMLFDDKKYRKAKICESVNQLLGNVLVPVACVGGASRLYKKYSSKIQKYVPQINMSIFDKTQKALEKRISTKAGSDFNKYGLPVFKGINKFLRIIPPCGITAVSLGCGIVAGNRVSNFLNEKVFNKKVDRRIQKTDFAPHVDDLSMAITLMADKSAVSGVIARTIPAFLCIPGLEVGKHR